MIRSLKGRIHFAHIRNMEHTGAGKFEECAHLSEDGSFDLFEIMKALYDIGFDGIMRPDHGRMIWGEQAMPGMACTTARWAASICWACGRPSPKCRTLFENTKTKGLLL